MSNLCTRLRIGERGYPPLLAESPDPPESLYVLGRPEVLLLPTLSVVGSRNATPYGLSVTRRFAGWAAESGYCVVSGGARGCDQAAHIAALDGGGPTVAVMAGGADVVYPASATALHAHIASEGAVVSEHPWGSSPRKWTFRARNRLIAWLSSALLVVEAGLPSGTFSTADFMAAAGRDVLAVPGSILSEESRGPNRLIAQGAIPVTDVSEFSMALRSSLGPAPNQVGARALCASSTEPVLRALRAHAQRPDDLAFDLGIDVVEVARRIGVLEMAGEIRRCADGRYTAIAQSA